tara:strand:+ start:1744 stop:1905 length:162 start_codon:yes stop_codon:yes gene_type:complete
MLFGAQAKNNFFSVWLTLIWPLIEFKIGAFPGSALSGISKGLILYIWDKEYLR